MLLSTPYPWVLLPKLLMPTHSKRFFKLILIYVSLSFNLYNIIDIHYYVWSEMEDNNQGQM